MIDILFSADSVGGLSDSCAISEFECQDELYDFLKSILSNLITSVDILKREIGYDSLICKMLHTI